MSTLATPRGNIALLIVLLVVQLLMMSGSARNASGATLLERWVMQISAPVVALADAVAGVVRGAGTGSLELMSARQRNVAMEAEIERLRAELDRDREAVEENERLRRLLSMRAALAPRSLAASVVTAQLDGHTKMIVIDRGRADGVGPDMPVIAWGAAVGRIVVASRGHAKVRLLTDPNIGIGGVVQRSRVQGLVKGTLGERLDLLYVPRFSDVIHGDRVVTSGLEGIFPRGVGLGRVSAVTEAADGTQTIHLDPEIDYASVEEVLVILGPGESEGVEQGDPRADAEAGG